MSAMTDVEETVSMIGQFCVTITVEELPEWGNVVTRSFKARYIRIEETTDGVTVRIEQKREV